MRFFLLFFFLAGCSSTLQYEPGSDEFAFDAGVPNFYKLDNGVYRMGQPTSPKAWRYLAKQGIKYRIKLNSDDECAWCDDAGAEEAGIQVIRIPIEPRDIRSAGIVEGAAGVFKKVDDATINRILSIIRDCQSNCQSIVFGCTYGHDRTGLIAGMYRVRYGLWSKEDAYHVEMLERGFHPQLIGLKKTWDEYQPQFK